MRELKISVYVILVSSSILKKNQNTLYFALRDLSSQGGHKFQFENNNFLG